MKVDRMKYIVEEQYNSFCKQHDRDAFIGTKFEIVIDGKTARRMVIGMSPREREMMKKALEANPTEEKDSEYFIEAEAVLVYLSEVTGKTIKARIKGKPTGSMKEVVRVLKQGYSKYKYVAVITNLSRNFHFRKDNFHHLNPETIRRHFDTYWNQVPKEIQAQVEEKEKKSVDK